MDEYDHDGMSYNTAISYTQTDGNIYCSCPYDYKDNIKLLGFKWYPKSKLWYIESKKLTFDVYKQTRAVRYRNKNKLYYHVHYIEEPFKEDSDSEIEEIKHKKKQPQSKNKNIVFVDDSDSESEEDVYTSEYIEHEPNTYLTEESLFIKIGEELNIKMWCSLTKEQRGYILNDCSLSTLSEFYTCSVTNFEGCQLMNIINYDPYCGLMSRDEKAYYSLNLKTMKPTRNSQCQIKLSDNLCKKIKKNYYV